MMKVYGILVLAAVFSVGLGFLGHYHHLHPVKHPKPETLEGIYDYIRTIQMCTTPSASI